MRNDSTKKISIINIAKEAEFENPDRDVVTIPETKVVRQYFQVRKFHSIRKFSIKKLYEIIGLQMICAFGANLMYVCHGMIFAASGFLIPKLEDPIEGFGISVNEGSWVGKNIRKFKSLHNQIF